VSELVREAKRDGRRVALLRCYDVEGGTVVEAEVTPMEGESAIHRGPYRFRNAPEAFRFVQETLLALQYLGCKISQV
jgi:hypothetical protein